MATQLNDIIVLVNNKQISYMADSLVADDGFGEYNVRNAVVGGGQTEQIFSKDLSSKVGKVKFSMPTTVDSVADSRAWKSNDNNNVVELIGPATGKPFTRIFTQASIKDSLEYSFATDGNVEVAFEGNPAQ